MIPCYKIKKTRNNISWSDLPEIINFIKLNPLIISTGISQKDYIISD